MKNVEKFREETLQENNKDIILESTPKVSNNAINSPKRNKEKNQIKINKIDNGNNNNIYNKEKLLNSSSIFRKNNKKGKESRNKKKNNIMDYKNISARITYKKQESLKNKFNEEIVEDEHKFQTIITHESVDEKQSEIGKNNNIPEFVNYIEKDKFIYDDLKYLELVAKDHIDNNINKNKVNENISDDFFEKNKNNLKISSNFTYTKPQLIRCQNNKKIYLSQNTRKFTENTEENIKTINTKDNILSISDEYDDISNDKKPLKMFFHENNISTINSKNEKDQNKEDIYDSDDEGFINSIHKDEDIAYKTTENYRKKDGKLKNIIYEINITDNLFINIANDTNNNKNIKHKINSEQ